MGAGADPVLVLLTDDQMESAREHARRVIAHAHRHRMRQTWDTDEVGELERKTRGYAAELAAAIATGLSGPHWQLLQPSQRKPADIGERTDVKQTEYEHGHLTIHDGEPPGFIYVQATGNGPMFAITGWIEGADAMAPAFRRETGVKAKGWWIPQRALRPLPLPADA